MWDSVRRVFRRDRKGRMLSIDPRSNETIRRGAPGVIEPVGSVVVMLTGKLATRVRQLAIEAEASSVEAYCQEMLEWFVVEYRTGKMRGVDPDRHTAQHEPDYSGVPSLEL